MTRKTRPTRGNISHLERLIARQQLKVIEAEGLAERTRRDKDFARATHASRRCGQLVGLRQRLSKTRERLDERWRDRQAMRDEREHDDYMEQPAPVRPTDANIERLTRLLRPLWQQDWDMGLSPVRKARQTRLDKLRDKLIEHREVIGRGDREGAEMTERYRAQQRRSCRDRDR